MPKLLTQLTFLVPLLITLACSKPDVPGEGPDNPTLEPDFTETPATSPVTSRLTVYTLQNNQVTEPFYVGHNDIEFEFNEEYRSFNSADKVTLDQYASTITVRAALTTSYRGFRPRKTFTATGAAKNYVSARLLPLNDPGSSSLIYDNDSGTVALPGGGQLVLPPYSFGTHSGAVGFSVRTGFTHPFLADHAVSMPCYPMADEKGKRWFLDSHGMYLFAPVTSDNSWFDIDFNPQANVVARMPVPQNLSSLPDSIPAWNLDDQNRWQRNGHAVRVGNFYEKKITRKGYWNFALPVSGVYTTVRLRTSTGLPVPNIRYIIKSNGGEVADGRTDSEGNGLAFVPSNRDLAISFINDNPMSDNIPLQNLPMGRFTKASPFTFTLPARVDVMTLEGTMLDCDGKLVPDGEVGIRSMGTNDEYRYPVKDGKFSAVQWFSATGYHPTDLAIYSKVGGHIITHSTVFSAPRPKDGFLFQYRANFYTCRNARQLYSHYRLDTAHVSLTGSTGQSLPELTSRVSDPVYSRISIMQNGKGVRFTTMYSVSTEGTYVDVNGVEVNGVPVELDPAAASVIYVYRNDDTPGGIKEGWYVIHYKDTGGNKHVITGTFRVQIT